MTWDADQLRRRAASNEINAERYARELRSRRGQDNFHQSVLDSTLGEAFAWGMISSRGRDLETPERAVRYIEKLLMDRSVPPPHGVDEEAWLLGFEGILRLVLRDASADAASD